MNDDASTFELPEYIHSRLQPQIFIDFPERDEEYQILQGEPAVRRGAHPEYVTDFLQLAHAADERYTVRDGINIARFAIKLKSLATAADARNRGAGDRHHPGAGRGSAALCPGKSTFRFLIRAACGAAASPISRWCPGAWSSPSKCAQAILRERPQVVALELPATLQPAWMRAVARLPEMSVIFYPDEDGGEDQAIYVPVEPADPFTEAIRTGLEIGAEIVFADPDPASGRTCKDAYPGPVRDPPHRPGALRRSLSRLPAAALGRDRAARRRHRLEAAGRRSRWRACWWWFR